MMQVSPLGGGSLWSAVILAAIYVYVASITVVITEQFMKDKDRENMFYIVYRFTKGVVKLPVITDIQYIYAHTYRTDSMQGRGLQLYHQQLRVWDSQGCLRLT